MIRIGVILVIGGIIISIGLGMYMYIQYQPNMISAKSGEIIVVGPVEYTVIFDGTSKGNKNTIPKDTFVSIKITAKNIKSENTWISENQFFFVDEKEQKHKPIHIGLSKDELKNFWLKPNKASMFITQFDVPYDESKQYNFIVLPSKQQSSLDIALVCITNC